MSADKVRKVGSGRKRGSYSFTEVSLAELNRLFKPDATVICSRKWCEANKIHGIAFKATHNVVETIGEPVEVTEIDFNAKT